MPVDPGTFILETDVTSNRLADPTWVARTGAFLGFADNRRRTGRRFWDPYQAAQATIRVRDSTGAFEQETIDRGKIRFSVMYNMATYRQFTGTVWNVETVATLNVDTHIRELTCYDLYADFNEAVIDTTSQIDAGASHMWIGRVLDRYGLPTSRRVLEPGRVNLPDFTGQGLQTVSYLLRLAEQAEGGNIWIDRVGNVRFVNRNRLNALAAATPVARFGEGQLPAQNIQIDRGSRNLLNQQTVQPATPGQFTAVTVPDPASLTTQQQRIGVKPGPAIFNPLVTTSPVATSLAGFRVRLGATPPQRATFVTHPEAVNETNGEVGFQSIYGLDIGSVISCDFPRQGFAGNCYIEGMATTFSRERNTWRMRITAVQTPSDRTFTLADANDPMDTRGVLETNSELGF